MINIYTGRPGNGKSYHAVDDIAFYLRHGVNVITNIDINTDLIRPRFRKTFGSYIYLTSDQMAGPDFFDGLFGFALNFHHWSKDGKTKEGQTVLIVDECQQDQLLNCRTWNNKNRKQWNDFFALHRHYGFKVLLITQSMSNIDKQAQKLIQLEYEHRNFGNFNPFCKFISLLLHKQIFVVISRDVSLKRSPSAARMGARYMFSNRNIYKLYNSYTVIDFRKKAEVHDFPALPDPGPGIPSEARERSPERDPELLTTVL